MIYFNSKHPSFWNYSIYKNFMYRQPFQVHILKESEGMVKCSDISMESCTLFLVFNGTHAMCVPLNLVRPLKTTYSFPERGEDDKKRFLRSADITSVQQEEVT